jgi:hypothetical protein
MLIEKKPLHWPTLNTVIMIEDTLRKSNKSIISVPELKRNLPKQVNHNTLILILNYLEQSAKIVTSLRGITWTFNKNKNLEKEIKKGLRL